jgi:hypothetical protein
MPMRQRMMLMGLLLLFGGCSAPQIQNTRLGSEDLVKMTDRMTKSLLAYDVIRSRNSESPAWIMGLDRVSNRTNDIMPDREKWAFMARLRGELASAKGLRDRNVRFVLSRDRSQALAERTAPRVQPTHLLTATFYAVTTATRSARSDAYLCTFQLMEASSTKILWEDKYELKRAVLRGRLD